MKYKLHPEANHLGEFIAAILDRLYREETKNDSVQKGVDALIEFSKEKEKKESK